jgi:protein-S-isoprenylcysteine O-methyltransferase Ste14
MNSTQIIIGCWMGFIVFWTIGALFTKRVAERQSYAGALPYKIPVALGALLLFFQIYHPRRRLLDWGVVAWGPATGAAGALACALGLLLAIWARVTLAGNWSSSVTFKEGHELVRRGPYRFARHPIYTAILLMGLGTAIASERVGAYVGVLFWLLGFWIKLKGEEALLERHFPAEYPEYKRRVKALVPFLF